jgi:hypothetical protein
MNVEPTILSAGQRLQAGVRPYLPSGSDQTGPSAIQLTQACDSYLSGGTQTTPYPELPADKARAITQNLKELSQGAQADFAAKVPGGTLSVTQLLACVGQLKTDKQNEVKELEARQSELKGAYRKQVVKTVAWMGATAGALVLGGLLPNPVTGLILAGCGAMAVRHISKARTAQKELQQTLPPVEANLKAARQLAADSVFYAPHLAGWNDLLSSQPQSKAA